MPTKIKFYPNKIEDNDYLIGVLDKYNLKADGTKKDVSEQIRYVDNVSAVMSLVRLVLGGVSGVLGFVFADFFESARGDDEWE